nr:integrase core domain-containing protein [Holospora elegans]
MRIKIKYPQNNGQVERMNRTLKEATVNSFHYASHDELKQHVRAYLMAYNFAKRLKGIKGKIPWQFILNQWTIHLEYFIPNPNHFLLGLNMD